MEHKPKAIILMGPTAAGKTDLAIELSVNHNCEIISVDSALIYKGLDIGSAKPDQETLRQAPHHLVDIIEPFESYSAVDFVEDARALMDDIQSRGKTPLLVGGTMLYYRALLQPLDDLPTSDENIREALEREWQEQGSEGMHSRLNEVDPVAAQKIHPRHKQRLLRALEVYRISGQPISDLWQQSKPFDEQTIEDFDWQIEQIVVAPNDRKVLHKRIERRYHIMMEQGFEQEVINLRKRGDLDPTMNSMRCVGYRQMWDYLDGKLGYEEMIERGIIATRQLAKRQLTWLRGWPSLTWFDSSQENATNSVIKHLKSKNMLS